MDCKTCKENRNVIPYIAHEAEQARSERHIKRLLWALVIVVVLMFASNAIWLWAWMQYDYVDEEYTVEMDAGDKGNANYIGGDGEIHNGENPSD